MTPPRILVVDDQEAILFALQDYLTAQGYEVDCARDVPEANSLTTRASYSAIIADLRLSGPGGMEGIEILQFVKERSPSTATVLLTAYRSPTVDAEAQRCKVDAILDKPIPLDALARAVAGLLRGHPPP
jgi:DNA-binding NtrC family response regulator